MADGNVFLQALENIANTDTADPTDYTDEQGFLVCGKCHTRKQAEIQWPDNDGSSYPRKVPVPCKCLAAQIAARDAEEERVQHEAYISRLRSNGIPDPAYRKHTFANDDHSSPKVSDVCSRYVANWEQMRDKNIGILFYGSVGTGKSFFACAIANALIEQGISAMVTGIPKILNQLQTFGDAKQEVLDKLQHCRLLVIDDLGVERDTSYGLEQIYNIIDTRSRANLPLIVTTNLDLPDLENPEEVQYKRIYDRILEMCPIRLKLAGKSRRIENADERKRIAREILMGGES